MRPPAAQARTSAKEFLDAPDPRTGTRRSASLTSQQPGGHHQSDSARPTRQRATSTSRGLWSEWQLGGWPCHRHRHFVWPRRRRPSSSLSSTAWDWGRSVTGCARRQLSGAQTAGVIARPAPRDAPEICGRLSANSQRLRGQHPGGSCSATPTRIMYAWTAKKNPAG